MTATHTTDIAAPLSRVFDLLQDAKKQLLWITGLEETIYLSERDPQDPTGTRFKQRLRTRNSVIEYEGEMLAFNPPHHLSLRIGDPQISIQVDYELEPIQSGTRLHYRASIEPMLRLGFFVKALFTKFNQRMVETQLPLLKRVAEEGYTDRI